MCCTVCNVDEYYYFVIRIQFTKEYSGTTVFLGFFSVKLLEIVDNSVHT